MLGSRIHRYYLRVYLSGGSGPVLAAYGQEIAEGKGLTGKTTPHVKTIQNYLRSAVAPIIAKGHPDPRFLHHATDRSENRIYVPLLARVFATAKKWTPPSRPEQPITLAMLQYLVDRVGSSISAEFALSAVVRDAVILATFTGSRVSEYAQTQAQRGLPFSSVPHNAASGSEGGKSIAFIPSNFQFFTTKQLEVTWSDAADASYVRIRFRYTKGVHNFTSRMFSRLPSSPFCPVQAALRAYRRWARIAPGPDTPIFCFLPAFFFENAFLLSGFARYECFTACRQESSPRPSSPGPSAPARYFSTFVSRVRLLMPPARWMGRRYHFLPTSMEFRSHQTLPSSVGVTGRRYRILDASLSAYPSDIESYQA